MSIVKYFLFILVLVTISGLPELASAQKSCTQLWSPGKVYNKYTMNRCDLEFKKLSYEALSSFPDYLWK